MHIKSLSIGLVVGTLVGAGAMLFFGDTIRGQVTHTKEKLGETVEQAGEALKDQGSKLK